MSCCDARATQLVNIPCAGSKYFSYCDVDFFFESQIFITFLNVVFKEQYFKSMNMEAFQRKQALHKSSKLLYKQRFYEAKPS